MADGYTNYLRGRGVLSRCGLSLIKCLTKKEFIDGKYCFKT